MQSASAGRMPSRPRAKIVNLLQSNSYRTSAGLRDINRRLAAANDTLREMNGELMAEIDDLYRENLTLLLELTRYDRERGR